MRRHTGFVVPPGSTVYLHQAFFCCPFAGMVTSQIHDWLESNGYTVTQDPSEAVAHIVNSCGSDARQADLTFQAIETIRATGETHPVVIAGCLNSIEPRRLKRALGTFEQTALLDPRNLSALDELFEHKTIDFDRVPPSLNTHYSGTPVSQAWHHIGIGTGCFGKCKFCAIRRANGRPKSSSIETVIGHINRAVSNDSRDILLVSTDASAWGTDLGLSIVDLLRAIVQTPGDALFAAEAFEPLLFLEHFDELLPLFRTGRFSFIGLPIQSGNPRVLREMGREYAVDDVVAAVQRLAAECPELVVRTDFIYGFGDETEAEFEDSIRVSRAFDVASFNVYQERPGTTRRTLSAEVLASRRERVMIELRERAHIGQKVIRRRGECEPIRVPTDPCTQETSQDIEPEVATWVNVEHRKFARLLRRRGPLPLGRSSWLITQVAPSKSLGGVLLTANLGPAEIQFMLSPADFQGAVVARSERYSLWVASKDWVRGGGRGEALNALITMLKLKRP